MIYLALIVEGAVAVNLGLFFGIRIGMRMRRQK